ncbi:unnamed protein product [Lepeophtheirus salmonis]|uniref:(salmon louse) hypothetical protein n=1 Tax=Lepeophtheirus salmonis TaxID=72036 RepID=A0A7R8H2J6_LEPSM|nr:unnamed protein product [Lepeophtheirus salmonis]CAF2825316.1 unnamed protein product [Lepeophtheirus salmonis]
MKTADRFHFDTTITKKLLDDVIIKIESNSFEIRVIVCGLVNHTLRSELGIDKGNFSFTNPFDSSRVVYIFPDSPHPLKLFPLVKTDFEGLLMKDSVEFKIDFKLKPLHIYCKGGARQRIRLAAQVLSNTVAKAFTIHSQSKEARAKENAVEMINNWVDVVNSRQIYDKVKLRCALGINFEDQFIALDKMELFLDTFKVLGRGNKSELSWQRGMRVSNKSTRVLYHDLISNGPFSFILMSRTNQDCLEICFTRLSCAGGDDDHLGAVGAMKRMRILEIGKNCETLVINLAIQIEKEYDIYRIEDEEEKESVTKQITGDILDITMAEESCSEVEFTFEIPHEVHVDFAINHQLDQFKKWDLKFQGLSYVSGFIVHKTKLFISGFGEEDKGVLMVPSDYFLRDCEVFDQKFKEFHLPLLDYRPKVIERFCQVLEDSFGGKYDKAVLNLFAKTRTMIQIRYLNAQLEFNTGGSEKIRGKKQIGQFQV